MAGLASSGGKTYDLGGFEPMKQPCWLDWMILRLFRWRWNPIFQENLEIFDRFFVNLALWRAQRAMEINNQPNTTEPESPTTQPGQDSQGNWIN